MLKSKYIDFVLILVMAYIAFSQIANGKMSFGIFFAVLCLLNIVTLVMKLKQEKLAKSNT